MSDNGIIEIGSVETGEGDVVFQYKCGDKEFVFALAPEVAKPNAYSIVLLKALDVRRGDRVLDLGTGTGFVGIMAAALNPSVQVVATDINPLAVALAQENALRNGVGERFTVLEGSIYDPVGGQQFDLIVSQPRQTPTPAEVIKDEKMSRRDFYYNTSGGIDGVEFIKPMISEAGRYLHVGGRLQLVVASYLPINYLEGLMTGAGFRVVVAGVQKTWLSPMTKIRRSYIENNLGYSFPRLADGRQYMKLMVLTGYYERNDSRNRRA